MIALLSLARLGGTVEPLMLAWLGMESRKLGVERSDLKSPSFRSGLLFCLVTASACVKNAVTLLVFLCAVHPVEVPQKDFEKCN